MHMSEMFDVVDEKGQPTGRIVSRQKAHEQGIRHRTAHIWIVREVEGRRQVLLQKRSAQKDSFPGMYDTSSAGHIRAGDEPRESALRELGEELGIMASADQLTFVGTFTIRYAKEFHGAMFKDNEISFVFLYQDPVDIDRLTLQKEEVERVDWFDIEDTYQAILAGDDRFCVPRAGLKLIMDYTGNHPVRQ